MWLRVFFLSIFLVVESRAVFFSLEALEENYDFHLIKLSNSSQDSIFLTKVDSLWNYGLKGRAIEKIRIRGKAISGQFPQITFYYVGTKTEMVGPEDCKNLIFYNTNNNRTYTYCGSIGDFNAVFYPKTDRLVNCDYSLKLIELFITTQYPIGPVYFFKGSEDFLNYYDSVFINSRLSSSVKTKRPSWLDMNDFPPEYPDTNYESDAIISKAQIAADDSLLFEKLLNERNNIVLRIEPIRVTISSNKLNIRVFTFGGYSSKSSIERWEFEVNSDFINIIDRQIIVQKIGRR